MSDFILGPNQTKWLAALRSGDYPQVTGNLHTPDGFCCLGVGCMLFAPGNARITETAGTFRYSGHENVAPKWLIKSLALYGSMGERSGGDLEFILTELNDTHHKTFAEIADIVEANPAAYFRVPS